MASAGASCTVTVEDKDRTSRLKLYVAKILQKFTLACVRFAVTRQWTVLQDLGFPLFRGIAKSHTKEGSNRQANSWNPLKVISGLPCQVIG
jgi:hypothetical protein